MKRSLMVVLMAICGMYLVLTITMKGDVSSETSSQDPLAEDYSGDYYGGYVDV